VANDLSKLTTFLTEVGVINTLSRPLWRMLGLLPDPAAT
jgi:hypothetical protein